jgi:hypothetical protein
MRLALLVAVILLILLLSVFGFAIAWLVWGEPPWDPGARDRDRGRR